MQVEGDGNCLPTAVVKSLDLSECENAELFDQMALRRLSVVHLFRKYDILKDWLLKQIAAEYGRADCEGPPISLYDWILKILRNAEWLDQIWIGLITSLLCVRLTVIRADSLGETRFRHNVPIDMEDVDVDIVLIYNGVPSRGHYSLALMVSSSIVLAFP